MQHISYFILKDLTPVITYNQPENPPYVAVTTEENETVLNVFSNNKSPQETFNIIEAFSKFSKLEGKKRNPQEIEKKIKLKTEIEKKVEKKEKTFIQKVFSSEEKEKSLKVLLINHHQLFKSLIDNKIQQMGWQMTAFEKQLKEEENKLSIYQNEIKELEHQKTALERNLNSELEDEIKKLVKDIEEKGVILKKLNDKNLIQASQLDLELEVERLGVKLKELQKNPNKKQDTIKKLEDEIKEKQKELNALKKSLSNKEDAETLEKALMQEIEKIKSEIDAILKKSNGLMALFSIPEIKNSEERIKNLQEQLNKKIIFHHVIDVNKQMQKIADNIQESRKKIKEYSELLKNKKDKNTQINNLTSGVKIMKKQLEDASNIRSNISESEKKFLDTYSAVQSSDVHNMMKDMNSIIHAHHEFTVGGMIEVDSKFIEKEKDLLEKIKNNEHLIDQVCIKLEVEVLNKEIYELGINSISREECAEQLTISIINTFLTEIRNNKGDGILFDRKESPWAAFLRDKFTEESTLVSDAIAAIKKVGNQNHDASYYLEQKEMTPVKKMFLKLYDICLAWIPFVSKSRSLQRDKISKFLKHVEKSMTSKNQKK